MDAPWGRPWGEEIGRQPFYVREGFKSVPGTLSHIATIDMFGYLNVGFSCFLWTPVVDVTLGSKVQGQNTERDPIGV